jgi:Protein of unknown function (DUF1176)
MNLRPILLLIAMTVSSSVLAAPPQLAEQKFYKDWAVVCDNSLSCESVSLPPQSFPDNQPSIVLKRDARTGDVAIEMFGLETTNGQYRVLIDRKLVHKGDMPMNAGDAVRISGADALRLARQLAVGSKATLMDGSGKELGSISLSGSRQALGYIDQIQNRAGTATALTRQGRKSLRPKWMPKPVILAKRVVPVDATPDAAALVNLAENSPCKDARVTVTEDKAYSLGTIDGKAKALVLISCGSGAYNFSVGVYVATEAESGKWTFAAPQLDYDNKGRMIEGDMLFLINGGWDTSTQSLGSFSKSRGLGDCGEALSYVWDGAMFRLADAIGMAQCRGSMDWMTLWQAEVKLVD